MTPADCALLEELSAEGSGHVNRRDLASALPLYERAEAIAKAAPQNARATHDSERPVDRALASFWSFAVTFAAYAEHGGDLALASRIYELTPRFDPLDVEHLGRVRAKQGRHDEAIVLLERFLRLVTRDKREEVWEGGDPTVEARRFLAACLHAVGRTAEAIAIWKDLAATGDVDAAERVAELAHGGFALGDSVRHAKLGDGRIVALEGSKARIRFGDAEKQLDLSKAKLELLERALRKGQRVVHSKYGEATVAEVTLERVRLHFWPGPTERVFKVDDDRITPIE